MSEINEITRSIVLRCMRKALQKIHNFRMQRSDHSAPRYGELMTGTLRELHAEGFPIQDGNATWDDIFTRSRIDSLSIALTEGYGQLLSLGYIVPRPSPPNAPEPN
jgi:hypothetical protein